MACTSVTREKVLSSTNDSCLGYVQLALILLLAGYIELNPSAEPSGIMGPGCVKSPTARSYNGDIGIYIVNSCLINPTKTVPLSLSQGLQLQPSMPFCGLCSAAGLCVDSLAGKPTSGASGPVSDGPEVTTLLGFSNNDAAGVSNLGGVCARSGLDPVFLYEA